MSSVTARSWLLLLLALLLAAPVLVVVTSWLGGPAPSWPHLTSTVLPTYLSNSLVLTLCTGLGSLVIGVGSAWAVVSCDFPGRRLLRWALLLPMACPAYLIAYTWTGLLAREGWLQQLAPVPLPDIRTTAGAALMLTLVLYPYVYLLARAAFASQSAVALEVARTLGAGPWRRFTRVALPLARPAIVAGLALVLMETLADYGTVAYFGVPTLSTGIYRTWFGLADRLAAAQMAATLLVLMVALLWIERRARQNRRIALTGTASPALRISGGRAWLLSSLLALPVIAGFALPALQLLYWALPRLSQLVAPGYLDLLVNSLAIATLTALVTVCIGLLLTFARRLNNDTPRRVASRVAAFGYAVPGTVLAIGAVICLGALDHQLNALTDLLGFGKPGLVFSGTLFAVVFACSVRFLTIPVQGIEAALQGLSTHLDDAARSMGHRPRQMLRRIHLPLLRAPLATSALLVFVDTLKELPATLVLRPFDTNTLAVRAFELASDERLADAAVPALTILLAGLVPVLMLTRSMQSNREKEAQPHA